MNKTVMMLTAITMLAISSCKKDELPEDNNSNNNNNPPVNFVPDYSTNLGLAAANAQYYIIADVEGLNGITKLNFQATTANGSQSNSSEGIDNGDELFVNLRISSNQDPGAFTFDTRFQDKGGSSLSNMIQVQNYSYCNSSTPADGMDLIFLDTNGSEWRCVGANNSTSFSSFSVQNIAYDNTGRYVEARFNCVLKKTGGTQTITLKNGVLKSRWY